MPTRPTQSASAPPHRIWFERTLPDAHLGLLGDDAVVAGSASDTTDSPLATLPGSHAIIASSGIHYDRSVMDLAPTVRVISRTGIGIDNIAIDEATARGIAVCNVPDGPTISAAEHTLALVFAVAKRIKPAETALASGQPDILDDLNGLELRDSVLGIVGLGKIGSYVARIGRSLGMVVVAHDPYVGKNRMNELGVQAADSLQTLLGRCDVVSLHTPLVAETEQLIDESRLGMMKAGAMLINTARGGLVDEEALLAALERGHLAGAGLDVFDPEPPDPANPLLHRDDVVATPHIATATTAARERLWRGAISQALQVLNGTEPPHLVNKGVRLRTQGENRRVT